MTDEPTIIEGSAVVVAQPQQQVTAYERPQRDPLRALGMMSAADFDTELAVIVAGTERISEIQRRLLRKGIDYDTIPGTTKDVLLQPGAERLGMIAHLVPRHEQQTVITAVPDHPDRIDVHTQTFLHAGALDGPVVGSAVASCSTWEERYRWRDAKRACPTCAATAIIKGKAEYGGGWICFKKQGGCGAKFADDDQRITSQTIGRVENEEPYGLLNTIVQISAKRGFVGAIRHTLGITDLFTQDVLDGDERPDSEAPGAASAGTGGRQRASGSTAASAPTSSPVAGSQRLIGKVDSDIDGVRQVKVPDWAKDMGLGEHTDKVELVFKVGTSKHTAMILGPLARPVAGAVKAGDTVAVDGKLELVTWQEGKPPKKEVRPVVGVTIEREGVWSPVAPDPTLGMPLYDSTASRAQHGAPEAPQEPAGMFDDDLLPFAQAVFDPMSLPVVSGDEDQPFDEPVAFISATRGGTRRPYYVVWLGLPEAEPPGGRVEFVIGAEDAEQQGIHQLQGGEARRGLGTWKGAQGRMVIIGTGLFQ